MKKWYHLRDVWFNILAAIFAALGLIDANLLHAIGIHDTTKWLAIIGITYTYPTVFNNPQNYHYLRPKSGGGLTSDMVDNYLIDLSAKTWAAFSTSTLLIDLRGNNAARTSASNAAVSTLVSKGVTVLTN